MNNFITVAYWHITKIAKWEHGEQLPYSEASTILSECLLNDLSVMFVPNDNGCIAYIGKGKLTQR